MLRLATPKDIPFLAQRYYRLKEDSCFKHMPLDWTVEGCATHLMDCLSNPDVQIVVDEERGKIVGACGGILYRDFQPPHPLEVGEWMWWGDTKKSAAKVLQHTTAWGKARGATLLHYMVNSQARKGKHRFTESHQWRVI